MLDAGLPKPKARPEGTAPEKQNSFPVKKKTQLLINI